MTKAIGGFFPLEDWSEHTNNNWFSLWGLTADNSYFFHNLRSAFWHLLIQLKPSRVWLPAYICDVMEQSVTMAGMELSFYPINETLSPDSIYLAEHLQAGECVLAVNYFGKPPDEPFRDLVRARTDVFWCEDSAQALSTGIEPWGDYVLYSPRKLMGVPDGGILRNCSKGVRAPSLRPLPDERYLLASRQRKNDLDETNNDEWYSNFVAYESQMQPDSLEMSEITSKLLQGTDPAAHIKQRQDNFETLRSLLKGVGLFDAYDLEFAPMGYALKVDDAQGLVNALAAKRMFVPRYWPNLPKGVSDSFCFESELSDSVVLLPVDQRYSSSEMRALAHEVSAFI